jgi:tagatose-6-phosphate ketose/aldose isomerase
LSRLMHVDETRVYETEVQELLEKPEKGQRHAGYLDTLREILQQPATWLRTAEQMLAGSADLIEFLQGTQTVVLTGSGSSEYAGECVRLVLQNELVAAAQTIGGGVLLTDGGRAIAPQRPCVMISLARSGDSPESAGALSLILESEPLIKHLIITCNQEGRLSEAYRNDPRAKIVVLDDKTNDRSLVMTSSFTNMVLASRSLGLLHQPERYRELAKNLHDAADQLLHTSVNVIAEAAREDFERALFLASGPRIGSARESALKMLEMTAGRVMATSETYLGLRHGPMSAVHSDTLIVCLLSSESPAREYECDVIRELQRKQLGSRKIIFGANIPADLVADRDLAIECSALAVVGDDNAPILDCIVGQLLGFFRCMKEGLTPDCPSESGVINRVVEEFALHLAKTDA